MIICCSDAGSPSEAASAPSADSACELDGPPSFGERDRLVVARIASDRGVVGQPVLLIFRLLRAVASGQEGHQFLDVVDFGEADASED